jgi:deazaflavin-dependent oxidoreductase (nitroreductase family)
VYAWLLPPWAVLLHRGRRSGRPYRTPVLAFKRGGMLVVALLYGDESQWLRNMRARAGRVVRAGRTYELSPPRVLETGAAAAELGRLNPIARAYCRLADKQVLVEVGDPLPGFGRGRHGD